MSTAAVAATPKVEKRKVTTTESIPYRTSDASLAAEITNVRQRGVKGVKTLTYGVTFSDGAEIGRRLLRQAVTRQPVTRVVAVGTKHRVRHLKTVWRPSGAGRTVLAVPRFREVVMDREFDAEASF